ncbi:sensor histidine kinase [Azospirillum griseum]|uniref:sensor histidine kinase n=1 Tax=Azospirillum griseum TaxID=2496639 RepID=UPI001FEB238D|nr:ATP-binding protein [Azospirillum griseum]
MTSPPVNGSAPSLGDGEAVYTAAGLAVPVAPLAADGLCGDARDRFARKADLWALAVVGRDGCPVGLVERHALLSACATTPDCDQRPITEAMDPAPLLVEAALPLGEVGRRLARFRPAPGHGSFIVVEAGLYRGLATVADLMLLSAEQSDLRARQLEAARRQADQANRAKTAFLANMSHEIRTPLNAMMGFAEILEQEVLGPHTIPLYAEYARDIADSGRHLMDLINDLLDLSKAEAVRLELSETRIDVPRVAASGARLLSERASRSGVRIVSTVPTDLPPLRADERKLRQMLLNLLSNAVKFTPRDGVVTVGARIANTGALWLSVHDTGIGMSGSELARAMEPWGQIDSALGRGHVGTGLGLPLTKCLIELHGGRLDVVSTPERGTTMSLIFPAARVER